MTTSLGVVVLLIPVVFVVLYTVARLVFAAYFKTRADFERNNQNGKK